MTQQPAVDTLLLNELIACETSVWEALVKGDAAADLAALHPDFLGVYPSGFAGRADHAAQLAGGPSVSTYRIEQPRILRIVPDCVLLAYKAQYTRVGTDEPAAMYVSSIWQRGTSGWLNIFSQDCEALPDGAENPLP